MAGSRVVCRLGLTTSWLLRVASSPPSPASRSGPFTPAAQTFSDAGNWLPSASTKPSAVAALTWVPTRTRIPIASRRRRVALEMSSGNAASRRGPASTRVMVIREARSGTP